MFKIYSTCSTSSPNFCTAHRLTAENIVKMLQNYPHSDTQMMSTSSAATLSATLAAALAATLAATLVAALAATKRCDDALRWEAVKKRYRAVAFLSFSSSSSSLGGKINERRAMTSRIGAWAEST